jgi:hypothetical protein
MGEPSPGPTRGERNNNPGNIDYDPHVDWQGQLGLEVMPPGSAERARFARFDTAASGIRAIGKILRAYIERDKCVCILAIARRWAPVEDGNDTDAYSAALAAETGLGARQVLDPDNGTLAELTRAIIHHENGRVIYDDVLIADATGAALA